MRLGSILVFAVAIAFAAAAALLGSSWLMGPAEAPPEVKAAPVPMKTVMVAARDLSAGERLTASSVREAAWPAGSLPSGAFTSREALFNGGEEPTLSAAIAENEPLVEQRLSKEPGLAGRLNDGMRGITIRVNEASSVGGFVQPEDHVDVLMTQTERLSEISSSMPRAYTKTLVRNVRVLAADQQTQRRQQTQPPKTVTLEVTEEDAKKLTLAGAIGQLSLTLNKGENIQFHNHRIDSREIAGLEERRQEAADVTADVPVVTVFRSVERKEYRVPQQ